MTTSPPSQRPQSRQARPALAAAALGGALLAAASPAQAQVHWDAAAQAGASQRVLGGRTAGGPRATVGAVALLTGHVALLPLLRVGGYVSQELSPMSGATSARDLTSLGLRAKLLSPWPRGATRAWLFVGLGYAAAYGRSTTAPGRDATVEGARGGFVDVPFGVGGSLRLRKPWELCAELGLRAGLGHTGSLYDAPGPTLSAVGQPDRNAAPSGRETFGIGVTVGVLLDL